MTAFKDAGNHCLSMPGFEPKDLLVFSYCGKRRLVVISYGLVPKRNDLEFKALINHPLVPGFEPKTLAYETTPITFNPPLGHQETFLTKAYIIRLYGSIITAPLQKACSLKCEKLFKVFLKNSRSYFNLAVTTIP